MTKEEKELDFLRKRFPRHVHGIGSTEHTGGRGERPRVHFDYTVTGSNIGYGYADALTKARENVRHWGWDPITCERFSLPEWEKTYQRVLSAKRKGMGVKAKDQESLTTFYENRGRLEQDEAAALLERAEEFLARGKRK